MAHEYRKVLRKYIKRNIIWKKYSMILLSLYIISIFTTKQQQKQVNHYAKQNLSFVIPI